MDWLNWLWLIPALGFGILETGALLNNKDRWQPATYWIRRLLMLTNKRQPLWWLGFGLWLWLGFHLLIDGGL